MNFREDIFPFKVLPNQLENLFMPDTDCSIITRNQPTSTPVADDDLGIASQNRTEVKADNSSPYVAPDMPLDVTVNDMEELGSGESNEKNSPPNRNMKSLYLIKCQQLCNNLQGLENPKEQQNQQCSSKIMVLQAN